MYGLCVILTHKSLTCLQLNAEVSFFYQKHVVGSYKFDNIRITYLNKSHNVKFTVFRVLIFMINCMSVKLNSPFLILEMSSFYCKLKLDVKNKIN